MASTDILSAAQASVDLVYVWEEKDHKDLMERMESSHGLHQLTYMKELHMGNDRYQLPDVDYEDQKIQAADAVKRVKPFLVL